MAQANQYLSFLLNLQTIGWGVAIVLFMVYLWWIGKNLK